MLRQRNGEAHQGHGSRNKALSSQKYLMGLRLLLWGAVKHRSWTSSHVQARTRNPNIGNGVSANVQCRSFTTSLWLEVWRPGRVSPNGSSNRERQRGLERLRNAAEGMGERQSHSLGSILCCVPVSSCSISTRLPLDEARGILWATSFCIRVLEHVSGRRPVFWFPWTYGELYREVDCKC